MFQKSNNNKIGHKHAFKEALGNHRLVRIKNWTLVPLKMHLWSHLWKCKQTFSKLRQQKSRLKLVFNLETKLKKSQEAVVKLHPNTSFKLLSILLRLLNLCTNYFFICGKWMRDALNTNIHSPSRNQFFAHFPGCQYGQYDSTSPQTRSPLSFKQLSPSSLCLSKWGLDEEVHRHGGGGGGYIIHKE